MYVCTYVQSQVSVFQSGERKKPAFLKVGCSLLNLCMFLTAVAASRGGRALRLGQVLDAALGAVGGVGCS